MRMFENPSYYKRTNFFPGFLPSLQQTEKKAFDKIQYVFLIKAMKKLGVAEYNLT